MGFSIREKNRLPTQLVFVLTLQISLNVIIIPWDTLTVTPWDTIISDEVVLLVIRPRDTSLISTVGVVPSFSMAFATRRSSSFSPAERIESSTANRGLV
jgi:hypothetical protein